MSTSTRQLRKALRAADPQGTGRLPSHAFAKVAASHGLDLLQPAATQAMRECLVAGSQVEYENFVSLLAPPPSRRAAPRSAPGDSTAAGTTTSRRRASRPDALAAAPRERDAASSALRQQPARRPSLQSQQAAAMRARPVVRLVGLDIDQARQVLRGLVPSGSSREALGLPHGLVTALRRLGVPDVFVGAMCAEVESYGSEEVLIDDYLEFVTHFGTAASGSGGPTATAGADPLAQPGGEPPVDARRLESLLDIEKERRELLGQRLDQNVSSLEEWTGAERQLSEDLLQAIAACEAELAAARSEGASTLQAWVAERRAFKTELERTRHEWAEDAAAQRRLVERLVEAVATARAEKQKGLQQRSEMQAQLLELSAAHQQARTEAGRLAENLQQIGDFSSERAATASELQGVTGRQEGELVVLGAENTRLRAQITDTEEEMDVLVAECAGLKSQLEEARR
jgi:hypothetical protein